MAENAVEKAKHLTMTDVKRAFNLYQINFGSYWISRHSDPRLDAVEALEAVQKRKP